jgi:hypothetical protein
MGKTNSSKQKITELKPEKTYKQTPSFESLIDLLERQQSSLDVQTTNSINLADKTKELHERTQGIRSDIIELAKDAKIMRKNASSRCYLIYFGAVAAIIILFGLILLLVIKHSNHISKQILNNQNLDYNNKNSKSILSNYDEINDYPVQLSNVNLQQDGSSKLKTVKYEYDYCTDYPLDNSQRAFYYFLSVLLTILSIILLIGTICVSRTYSSSLCESIREHFDFKYDLCCQELKLVHEIQSILDLRS